MNTESTNELLQNSQTSSNMLNLQASESTHTNEHLEVHVSPMTVFVVGISIVILSLLFLSLVCKINYYVAKFLEKVINPQKNNQKTPPPQASQLTHSTETQAQTTSSLSEKHDNATDIPEDVLVAILTAAATTVLKTKARVVSYTPTSKTQVYEHNGQLFNGWKHSIYNHILQTPQQWGRTYQ